MAFMDGLQYGAHLNVGVEVIHKGVNCLYLIILYCWLPLGGID